MLVSERTCTGRQFKLLMSLLRRVHAKGSYIYLQLWALGRAATGSVLAEEGQYDVVSCSDVPLDPNGETRGKDKPRSLSVDEIQAYVGWYAQAAKNFVEGAGGDGVESECLRV
jgi:NADPH2 dehydrogenase